MWDADIMNNPDHDYRLYIELREDDHYRGRIDLDDHGQLIFQIYPTESILSIPLAWLINILTGAQKELGQS